MECAIFRLKINTELDLPSDSLWKSGCFVGSKSDCEQKVSIDVCVL